MQTTYIDIVAHRFGGKNKVVFKAMQTHTDDLVALVGNRAQVDVLLEIVAPDQFCTDIDELIYRVGKGDLQNLA